MNVVTRMVQLYQSGTYAQVVFSVVGEEQGAQLMFQAKAEKRIGPVDVVGNDHRAGRQAWQGRRQFGTQKVHGVVAIVQIEVERLLTFRDLGEAVAFDEVPAALQIIRNDETGVQRRFVKLRIADKRVARM